MFLLLCMKHSYEKVPYIENRTGPFALKHFEASQSVYGCTPYVYVHPLSNVESAKIMFRNACQFRIVILKHKHKVAGTRPVCLRTAAALLFVQFMQIHFYLISMFLLFNRQVLRSTFVHAFRSAVYHVQCCTRQLRFWYVFASSSQVQWCSVRCPDELWSCYDLRDISCPLFQRASSPELKQPIKLIASACYRW